MNMHVRTYLYSLYTIIVTVSLVDCVARPSLLAIAHLGMQWHKLGMATQDYNYVSTITCSFQVSIESVIVHSGKLFVNVHVCEWLGDNFKLNHTKTVSQKNPPKALGTRVSCK